MESATLKNINKILKDAPENILSLTQKKRKKKSSASTLS